MESEFTWDKTTDLLKAVNNNCEEAEELALKTVTSNEMPFVNAFRELTRGDCWQVMRKHQDVFNMQEQALVLSALTDYVTCAYQSELFDTFRKKHDHDNFPALLVHLNGKWLRFFNRLNRYDLTHLQVKSLVNLLRHSLKRLPLNYSNLLIKEAVIVGEKFLDKILQPPLPSFTAENKKIGTEPLCKDSKDLTTSVDVKPKKSTCSKEVTTSVGSKPKKSVCLKELTTSSNVLHKDQKTSTISTSCNKKPSAPKRTLDFIRAPQAQIVDLTAEPKVKQKKFSSDITRYILKASENKAKLDEKVPVSTKLSNSLTEEKENLTKESTGSELDIKLKEPATPTGKTSGLTIADSPAKKKPQTEDTSTVEKKVNAFEVMMKQSRAVKAQKRKSLFS